MKLPFSYGFSRVTSYIVYSLILTVHSSTRITAIVNDRIWLFSYRPYYGRLSPYTVVKIVACGRVSLWINVKTSQCTVSQKTFQRAFKRLSSFQMSFLNWVVRCSDVLRYCNSFLLVWKGRLLSLERCSVTFGCAFLVFETVFIVCQNYLG